jgi:uncharacterized alpha-E superfamily protein
MISRVADHCFWLGRYLERAESTARVLMVTHGLALDGELPAAQVWGPAVTVSGEDKAFAERLGVEARGDGEAVQEYLTWAEENLVSISRSVQAARENARSIREVVSLEAWEALNALHVWMRDGAGRAQYEEGREAFYRHVRQAVQLVLGTVRSTMLHDNAFDFISLGVFLERVGQTARLLDVHHHALTRLQAHPVLEESLWLSLLRACSGFEPYMRSHVGRVTPTSVAAFLLLEPRFPRSVTFGLRHAAERLDNLRPVGGEAALPGSEAQRRLWELERWLAALTPEHVASTDLHALLTHVVEETGAVCADVQRELLAAPPPRLAVVKAAPVLAPAQAQSQAQGAQTQSQCA